MTDDKIQTLKDDIAFMRALAQEGSSAPLLGGSILVAAGLTFGAAGLVHWALMVGVLQLPKIALMVIWPGALAVFLTLLFLLKGRVGGRPSTLIARCGCVQTPRFATAP